jgi:hypothetical protein
MRFSSADASLTDHSFATGNLIEVNFRLFCATPNIQQQDGPIGRQACVALACSGEASSLFKRSFTTPFGLARRLNLAAIARTRRLMAAVNLSVSAGMIVTTKPHRTTRNQSANRRPTS